MNYQELQKKTEERYPALLLDRMSSVSRRKQVRTALSVVVTLLLAAVTFAYLGFPIFDEQVNYMFRSLLLISFALWLGLYLIEMMYRSYYFAEGEVFYDVARIVDNTNRNDITAGFLHSRTGQFLMARLAVPAYEVAEFLENRQERVTAEEYEVIDEDKDVHISSLEYARALMHFDLELKDFLSARGITPSVFKGALEWVVLIDQLIMEQQRWWTQERLATIPSVGKDWSYGKIYLLERFGHAIQFEESYIHLGMRWRLYNNEIEKIEHVMIREKNANVVIVSDIQATGMKVVSAFAKKISLGKTVPELEEKKMFVLDIEQFLRNRADVAVEDIFIQVLNQAAAAGNVILIIPDIDSFVQNAAQYGIDVSGLLDKILSISTLQVIATADTKGFHKVIEQQRDLTRHFSKLSMEDLSDTTAVQSLLREVLHVEAKHSLFFTYQSLLVIMESAKRYFSDSVTIDKAVDIMYEIVPQIKKRNLTIVTKAHVLSFVQDKTGIPLGDIGEEERRKLRELAATLHQRVIGQDAAITAVAETLKRSRAGLANPDRPMGTFLFLGPTGVGKTETTKALAESYFGNEDAMIRINMSEYTSSDALEKLIGSFSSGAPGVLSSYIREHQYGVLLLDEFEKTTTKVLDLFLQILDEGQFSDGQGVLVNARNLIIIATSNAGSDMIYEAAEAGEDIAENPQQVIDAIITRGIFKPELVNRFDAPVVFHVLGKEHLTHIAQLMIKKLNTRLSPKGIMIDINKDLISYLVMHGSDTQFGAREMNRVIQSVVEAKIADAMIDGRVTKGQKITFTKNETGEIELV